jgi:rRNA maturation endonuclease Nob1
MVKFLVSLCSLLTYCSIGHKQQIQIYPLHFGVKNMGFNVVCHGCGKLLYQGRDLIPLYRLRRRTDGKCPACGRKLAIRPLSIKFEESDGLQKNS